MNTTVENAFDAAASQARADIVQDILAGMNGRTFGVDYTKLNGEKRTMLCQVDSMKGDYVIVREINKTRTLRHSTLVTLRDMGFNDPFTDSDKEALRAYRTLRYDSIDCIRADHATYDLNAIFAPVTPA